MQPYDFPRASLFVHLGADWIHFCVKLKRLTFAFCPVHIVAPEFICCCWSWSPLPLSLCMKQQSKIFPWQRIRQETPSPLLPSPPLPPQLSAQTLLPKREREREGGERVCLLFSIRPGCCPSLVRWRIAVMWRSKEAKGQDWRKHYHSNRFD